MDARLWRPLFQELDIRMEQSFFCFEDLICPKLQVLAQQLRSCSYGGSAKRLFLEGKCRRLFMKRTIAGQGKHQLKNGSYR